MNQGKPKPSAGKKPQQQDPAEPVAGIQIGDTVFFKSRADQPTLGRVRSVGRDGFQAKCERGIHHRVTWDRYQAHHTRKPMSAKILHQGEDAMLARLGNGERVLFMNGEEEPMQKSLDGAILFMKAGKISNKAGLALKDVTDKAGHQTKRWTKTGQDAPANKPLKKRPDMGEKVHFDGDNHGHVIGSGKLGARVRSHTGQEHKVTWDRMHEPPEPQADPDDDQIDYPHRAEDESDKGYLKRVANDLPHPKKLPEQHDRYFNMSDATKKIPIDKLVSSKSDEENKKGGDNSPKFMRAAYDNKVAKRDPVTVTPHETEKGKYRVVDGNGTFTGVRKAGWSHLPANVVNKVQAAKIENEAKAKEHGKRALKPGDQILPPEQMAAFPPAALQPFNSWKEAEKLIPESQAQLTNAMHQVATQLGFKVSQVKPEDVPDQDWKSDEGLVFIGPPKAAERAKQKVKGDYAGDFRQLKDLVRATISVKTVDDVRAAVDSMQKAGLKIAARPKDKFAKPTKAGYRDFNTVVKLPSGVLAEIQFHLKDITMAKSAGHAHYETMRKLEAKYKSEDPDESWSDKHHGDYYHALGESRKLYGAAYKPPETDDD